VSGEGTKIRTCILMKKGNAQQDGKQHLRFLTVGQTARILASALCEFAVLVPSDVERRFEHYVCEPQLPFGLTQRSFGQNF
jgi:hypothetical protein